jgi:hypothetical protein
VRLVDRIALIVMAVSFGMVGVWAQFAPRSFYDDFPGGGRHWVSGDGPFNEHLVRDVGGLNLAVFVIVVAALVIGSTVMARVAGIAALAYALPHAVYHSAHIGEFDERLDQVALAVSLWGLVVLAAIVAIGRVGSSAAES